MIGVKTVVYTSGTFDMLTIPSVPIDDWAKLHQLVRSGIIHRMDGGKGVKYGMSDGIRVDSDGIKVTGDGINDGIKTKISAAVKKHPGIRVPELVLMVGKSKPTIERAVAYLKKEGIIEYHGSKKTGGCYLAPIINHPIISNQ